MSPPENSSCPSDSCKKGQHNELQGLASVARSVRVVPMTDAGNGLSIGKRHSNGAAEKSSVEPVGGAGGTIPGYSARPDNSVSSSGYVLIFRKMPHHEVRKARAQTLVIMPVPTS